MIFGVILAGGQATRMGGGDKSLRIVAGRRMMDHVIDRLAPQVAGLAISANGPPERFADFGLPVLPDTLSAQVEPLAGPLAGVLAGLDWAATQGATALVTAAADTPFFPRDLVVRLRAGAGASGVCLAASPDETGHMRQHPTFGLWPVALRDDLRATLQSGQRKMMLWTQRHQPGLAAFDSLPFDPFFNINHPEDLALAETLATRISPAES